MPAPARRLLLAARRRASSRRWPHHRRCGALLLDHLRRRGAWDAIDPCVLASLRHLETASVAALERKIGYSRRQIERRFARHAGYTPKQFARVARFRGALAALKSPTSGAEIAAALGYADQSHFVHEFREFTGSTPGAWRAAATDDVAFLQDGAPPLP